MISAIAAVVFVITLCGCGKSAYRNAFEYGKYAVTEPMYRYWMSNSKRNIIYSFGGNDTESFWNTEYADGQTVGEYYTDIINRRIKDYLISQYLFDRYGLTLPDSTVEKIDFDIKEKSEYFGGYEKLDEALSEIKIDSDILREIYTWEEKHAAVYDYLYGKGGSEEADAGDIISYYNDNYSRIQYIVFYKSRYVTDSDGNTVYGDDGKAVTRELTETERIELDNKIDDCLARIDSGESFAALMGEYSEYNTLDKYPNGFFVSDNELSIWGSGIVNGVKDAHPGQVFRVDEDGAVYIVLKCTLTDFEKLSDTDLLQLSELNTYVSKKLFEKKYLAYEKEVKEFPDVTGDNTISTVKSNPFFSF